MKRWISVLLLLPLGACGYNRIQSLDEQAPSAPRVTSEYED